MNGSNNMERLLTPSSNLPYPPIDNNNGEDQLTGLHWYKGSAHAINSQAAVRYTVEDPRATRILSHILKHYNKERTVPDETLYATLNHNYALLQFPGSYLGNKITSALEYRQIYPTRCGPSLSVAQGTACMASAFWALLNELNTRPEFFANKFFYDYQSEAFRCAQERFWNNTLA